MGWFQPFWMTQETMLGWGVVEPFRMTRGGVPGRAVVVILRVAEQDVPGDASLDVDPELAAGADHLGGVEAAAP